MVRMNKDERLKGRVEALFNKYLQTNTIANDADPTCLGNQGRMLHCRREQSPLQQPLLRLFIHRSGDATGEPRSSERHTLTGID